MYGLPHLVGLPTYTAPAGIRQPFVRLRWMRFGVVIPIPTPPTGSTHRGDRQTLQPNPRQTPRRSLRHPTRGHLCARIPESILCDGRVSFPSLLDLPKRVRLLHRLIQACVLPILHLIPLVLARDGSALGAQMCLTDADHVLSTIFMVCTFIYCGCHA